MLGIASGKTYRRDDAGFDYDYEHRFAEHEHEQKRHDPRELASCGEEVSWLAHFPQSSAIPVPPQAGGEESISAELASVGITTGSYQASPETPPFFLPRFAFGESRQERRELRRAK